MILLKKNMIPIGNFSFSFEQLYSKKYILEKHNKNKHNIKLLYTLYFEK